MGRRRVGDTPFDLYAYFEVIDNIAMPNRVWEENKIFTDIFMPSLREWSAHCMGKIEPKRESLAKVVGDACHQAWKKISTPISCLSFVIGSFSHNSRFR